MKKIAITQRLIENESYYEIREALDIQWGKLLKELDFLPIVLPYGVDFKSYFKYVKVDGIILTGGNDLASLSSNRLSVIRDDFEKDLIRYAIDNNIPLMGFCRGMQIIGEFFNCSLKPIKDQVGIHHTLLVNKDSKYLSELEKIDKVNSYHNYALFDVKEEILISSTDEKNIIKAIEHKKYKIFAQMWHTEREYPFNGSELNLIKEFFKND